MKADIKKMEFIISSEELKRFINKQKFEKFALNKQIHKMKILNIIRKNIILNNFLNSIEKFIQNFSDNVFE
jgi:hypothetical protein